MVVCAALVGVSNTPILYCVHRSVQVPVGVPAGFCSSPSSAGFAGSGSDLPRLSYI